MDSLVGRVFARELSQNLVTFVYSETRRGAAFHHSTTQIDLFQIFISFEGLNSSVFIL